MNGKFIRRTEAGGKTPAPSELQGLLVDTATLHSAALGYGGEFFAGEKKGWVLLTLRAEIMRLPRSGESLAIETWTTKARGLAAKRSFRVLDGGGGALAEAVSQWAYFDLERRRPVKIPEEMAARYDSGLESVMPDTKFAAETPPESLKTAERRLIVTRENTDSNMHVNNLWYIKWAEDGLPSTARGGLKSFAVRYRRESAEGETLAVTSYETASGEYVHFVTGADGSVRAEILMKFYRKDLNI